MLNQEAQYELGTNHPVMGNALSIGIGGGDANRTIKVHIQYSTTKDCTALGWLEKE